MLSAEASLLTTARAHTQQSFNVSYTTVVELIKVGKVSSILCPIYTAAAATTTTITTKTTTTTSNNNNNNNKNMITISAWWRRIRIDGLHYFGRFSDHMPFSCLAEVLSYLRLHCISSEHSHPEINTVSSAMSVDFLRHAIMIRGIYLPEQRRAQRLSGCALVTSILTELAPEASNCYIKG